MNNVVQTREAAKEDEKHEKEPFVFDKDDEFYMAPAIGRLLHYRSAAILCGLVEITILIVTLSGFFSLQLEKGNTHLWLSMALIILLVFATVTTFLMTYGILTEKPKYMWPQMAFMHIEVTILTISAIVSITSMSMGLQATHRLFGSLVSIQDLEKHFGPIWPFNMAVLSFFGAATVIWSYIIVRGAYDYLLDKEYFTKKPSIEMVKTMVVN